MKKESRPSPIRLLWRQVFAGAGAIAMILCSELADATTFTVQVGPNNTFTFVPATVNIQVGDTVQWVWGSDFHSTTSGSVDNPDGIWDSDLQSAPFTFSHTFSSAGTFPYFCIAHGSCCNMTGSVIVTAATPTPTPSISPTATISPSPTATATATPSATPSSTPTPTPVETNLGNISTRVRVETGDNVLIGGFIVTGNEPKKVIVRAIGPSLTAQHVVGALSDPVLELHTTDDQGRDVLLETNDNWVDSQNAQQIIDSTVPPANNLESAILRTLDPGSYTAILRGVNGATGITLLEVYDLDPAANSLLANISTRGFVQTGDNVMILGVIIVGTNPQKVLLRGIGPSLPVTGALSDPVLELHDKNGEVIATNDDWRSDQEKEIIETTIPPANDAESAILATLNPDAYTAVLRGKVNRTGVALIEAYQLDN